VPKAKLEGGGGNQAVTQPTTPQSPTTQQSQQTATGKGAGGNWDDI